MGVRCRDILFRLFFLLDFVIFLLLSLYTFWLYPLASWILVPQPMIGHAPLCIPRQNLKHWTAGKVPVTFYWKTSVLILVSRSTFFFSGKKFFFTLGSISFLFHEIQYTISLDFFSLFWFVYVLALILFCILYVFLQCLVIFECLLIFKSVSLVWMDRDCLR